MAVTVRDSSARGGGRPASGIAIVPAQLTRMRDLYPMSREDLARRTGELLFDRDQFARILSGQVPADARTARALWLALECEPGDIVCGLPPGVSRPAVPRWLRGNAGWSLNLCAVSRHRDLRGWLPEQLASAVARHWFTRDSVNKIERGERRPKARTLEAFCKVLGCTVAQLMPGGRPLPDGPTQSRRILLDYNAGMRAFADERSISYRNKNRRIRYSPELREAYACHLAGQAVGPEGSALVS